MSERIRVLVVDDSALMRKLIPQILLQDPRIEVVGTAMDGLIGLRKIEELRPHVVTLDLEMPRMDGIEMLRKIMGKHHVPVIVVSAHTKEGASLTLKALSLGAFDFVTKPEEAVSGRMAQIASELALKIRVAAASGAPKMIITLPTSKPQGRRTYSTKPLAVARGGHRCFDRRTQRAAVPDVSASRGFPGVLAGHPAHARRVYGNVCAAPRRVLSHRGQGSTIRRSARCGTGADLSRQPPFEGAPHGARRRGHPCRSAARQWASALGGCSVSFGRAGVR